MEQNVNFRKGGPINPRRQDAGLDHGSRGHDHSHDHGHTHELMENPGHYHMRDVPPSRSDWSQRAFTVGIGGPVGSGKTALVLALCRFFREKWSICVVTNDIFTRFLLAGVSVLVSQHDADGQDAALVRATGKLRQEDWEFLVRNEALEETRMRGVETGGCPHAAIREDCSVNLHSVKELTKLHNPQLVLLESGGDNLAANFSRELADYIIYVIDVAGGDKIPRKGGPGITQSDLLVINKTDLAEAVGASLEVMKRDADRMRQDGPTIFAQAKNDVGVSEVANHVIEAYHVLTGK